MMRSSRDLKLARTLILMIVGSNKLSMRTLWRVPAICGTNSPLVHRSSCVESVLKLRSARNSKPKENAKISKSGSRPARHTLPS